MGVYIRGMEIPKSCQECRFDNNVYCLAYPQSAEIIYDIADGIPKFCPLIEVPEQKHGKWKKAYLDHEAFGIRSTVVYCSECNLVGYWEPKYCPNCGARMDGEK